MIGVVCSKLAPIPKFVEGALKALKDNQFGVMYKYTASGQEKELSESQVVAIMLHYLRTQTQLVIGHAATTEDLSLFLKRNGFEP